MRNLFHFHKIFWQSKQEWGSSETRRGNPINAEPFRRYHVSIHRPQPRLPTTNLQFGFFLAGLIDSVGHFNKIPHLVITFHINDISLAYFLKSSIGFGTVRKVRGKAACRYVLCHRLGLAKVAELLQARSLCHPEKRKQYNERLLPILNQWSLQPLLSFRTLMPMSNLSEGVHKAPDPFWLAGFLAGAGCFQIKFVKRSAPRLEELRLIVQIDQKEESILRYIAFHLGGSVGYRRSQDTFYYSSVSFSNAAKFIKYLDQTHLVGSKMTQYVLWRRAFLLVQEGAQLLDPLGRCNTKLRRLKQSLDKLKH